MIHVYFAHHAHLGISQLLIIADPILEISVSSVEEWDEKFAGPDQNFEK